MVDKKNFIFLYSILLFVIIFLAFVYVVFSFNIKFPMSGFLFAEKDLEVNSKIVFMEGNYTYFTVKGGKKNIMDYNTPIKSDLIIETGKNSYIGFYIKDQGYYYLYPETSIYIKKIERYISEKSVKETVINLEKGRLYMNVNFYSINSYFVLETQDCYCELNDAIVFFDKTKDFETKITCYDGRINYRAYSEKFNFFEAKKNLSITNSIERLINTSNALVKNQYTIISVVHQNRLDSILNRLYESENTKLIDKEYITSLLKIPFYEFKKNDDVKLPEFDIIKFNAGNKGHLEIKTPENSLCELNGGILEKNMRYVFFMDAGKYLINQDLKFTRVNNNIQINENEKKTINLSDINGIVSVYVDNIKSLFETSIFDGTNERNMKNTLLLKVTNRQEGIKTIVINADIYVKELYYLSDHEVIPDNASVTGDAVLIDSRVMKSYKVIGGNKNTFEVIYSDRIKDNELFFIAVFDDIYINDL